MAGFILGIFSKIQSTTYYDNNIARFICSLSFSLPLPPSLSLPFPLPLSSSLRSKFWCRNRPGEELKDKYNSFNNPFFLGDEMGT